MIRKGDENMKRNILVVDDDEEISNIELIILGIMMPIINGVEVCKIVREKHNIPKINYLRRCIL